MQILTTESNTVEQNLKYNIFPWAIQDNVNPEEITQAEGVHFYNNEGKKYLDFSSQLVNMNLGHSNPEMLEAIAAQFKKFSFISPQAATKIKGELSEKLVAIAPKGMAKVFYTLSGAEANENAMKIARLTTGRHKVLTLYRSYHGATYGAISASGDPRKLAFDESAMPHIIHSENPYSYRCPWNTKTEEECGEMALKQMEQVIQYEGTESVAAILMEGESGSSGCLKYPPNFWKGVQALAEKYGILTICDEVMSGFGRTGKWFGIDNHGVCPDIMTMAKGITGGYLPLGAVMVKEQLASAINKISLPIGLTNSGHPLCLAAASKAIDIYKDNNLIKRAKLAGAYLEKELLKLQDIHPSLGDVRITGLLGCLELVTNKKDKTPLAPFNASANEMQKMNKVAAILKEYGLFTLTRWNFIFVTPPLIISKEDLDFGIKVLDKALIEADKFT